MTDEKKVKRGEDYTVVLHPEVQAQIDQDDDLAEFVRDTIARMRQALDGATDETVGERLTGAGFERVILDDIEDEGEAR